MDQLQLFDRGHPPVKNVAPVLQITKDLPESESPCKPKRSGKKLKVGENVHYHSVIGGPITSSCHRIYHIEYYKGLAWITNHGACVAIEALSRRFAIE